MSAPGSRRGFLRGLTTLPLIGGGVVLTGNPTAAAAPITPGMLATYSAWLHYERRSLHYASGLRDSQSDFVPFINPGVQFHFPPEMRNIVGWGLDAQRRAPVILAAAGCPLTDAMAEEQWATTFVPMVREGPLCA